MNPAPTASATSAPAEPAYKYDVFVTYSPADRGWVEGELVPRLHGAELRVAANEDDFEIGVPQLEGYKDAVRDSQYILAVISQSWLADGWGRFTAQVVAYQDVQAGSRRFVPVRIDSAALPVEIDLSTCADFTKLEEVERTWGRLTDKLTNAAAVTRPPAPGAAVRKAFRTLKGLMADTRPGGVRDQVLKYKGEFDPEIRRTRQLKVLKRLHDLLHQVQMQVYRPALVAVDGFPKPRPLQALREYRATLGDRLGRLRAVAAAAGDAELFRPPLLWLQPPLLWLDELAAADAALAEAVRPPAPGGSGPKAARARLDEAVEWLWRVVSTQPNQLNTELLSVARALDLPRLVNGLREIVARLEADRLEAADLDDIRRGVAELDAMSDRLGRLLREHNTLQRVDNLLRATEGQLFPPGDAGGPADPDRDLRLLRMNWGQVRTLTGWLFADPVDPRLTGLRDDAGRVTAAVDAADHYTAVGEFQTFRGQAAQVFFDIDVSLKELCDELGRVGQQLFWMLRPAA